MKKQDAEESGPQAADEAPATAGAVEDPRPTGSEPETSPAHTPPQSGGIGLDDKGFRHVVTLYPDGDLDPSSHVQQLLPTL